MASRIKVQELSRTEAGPIKSAILVHGAALELLKQRDQNNHVRNALRFAAGMWVKIFLPMRFTDYARGAPFNYVSSYYYKQWKIKNLGEGDKPNVMSGKAREYALTKNKIDARTTKNKTVILIRLPMPSNGKGFVYANSPKNQLSSILRTVPPREVKRIGQWVEKALAAYLGERPLTEAEGAVNATTQRAANAGQPRKRGRPPGRDRDGRFTRAA